LALVEADWVAGKDIPEPDADAVAAPTPIVVVNDGVVNVASVPVVVGKVSVGVPATAGAVIVTEPLVSPEITTEAILISYPMFFSQYNPS
jgi:hypothetical protein